MMQLLGLKCEYNCPAYTNPSIQNFTAKNNKTTTRTKKKNKTKQKKNPIKYFFTYSNITHTHSVHTSIHKIHKNPLK